MAFKKYRWTMETLTVGDMQTIMWYLQNHPEQTIRESCKKLNVSMDTMRLVFKYLYRGRKRADYQEAIINQFSNSDEESH